MLLIERDQLIRSVDPVQVPVPFVRLRLESDEIQWLSFCRQNARNYSFLSALATELRRCTIPVPVGVGYPECLFDAAAPAMARGVIGMGSQLPIRISVEFDTTRPLVWRSTGVVMFGHLATAVRFVLAAFRNPHARAALDAALQHSAADRNRVTQQAAGGAAGRLEDPDDPLVKQVALLLFMQHLVLRPMDSSWRRLELRWVERQPPDVPVPGGDAPSPNAAPPPSDEPPPPASTLPDAPDDIAPQVQALIDASLNGLPFCDECARRSNEESVVA